MIEICAVASGSNGNCYYIGNEKDAILVDAGISCRQILLRMKLKGLDPSKIKAVFISHEHSDHMRGARVFEKKLHVPVYITARTYNAAYRNMQPATPRFFLPGTEIQVGEFTIITFSKNHDASEPCSFRIMHEGKNIGVFTDIGEPCENVVANLGMCDAVFLEANYDEDMLLKGSYPWHLKKRIASAVGHLSNLQALELLRTNAGINLKCVFLSHLSAENNTPELAYETCRELSPRFEIRLTSRYAPADVFVL
jgi:phosphoribosyl 1,2-cyclic phosphodiesterase